MSLFLESIPTINPVRPELVEGRNGAQNKVWRGATRGSTMPLVPNMAKGSPPYPCLSR
ncbi:hypothetical protein GALL_210340 [mine drainage metagenome]|uniref:Uncharacterized protein n=1 Tax=mine drainage metagenome TaxID=410659 RepID=A0A1J5RYF4_9ZZZZ